MKEKITYKFCVDVRLSYPFYICERFDHGKHGEEMIELGVEWQNVIVPVAGATRQCQGDFIWR